jgi:hypothetical protein
MPRCGLVNAAVRRLPPRLRSLVRITTLMPMPMPMPMRTPIPTRTPTAPRCCGACWPRDGYAARAHLVWMGHRDLMTCAMAAQADALTVAQLKTHAVALGVRTTGTRKADILAALTTHLASS